MNTYIRIFIVWNVFVLSFGFSICRYNHALEVTDYISVCIVYILSFVLYS